MSDHDIKNDAPEADETEQVTKEYILEDFKLNPLSSAEFIKPKDEDADDDILEIMPPQLLIDEGLIAPPKAKVEVEAKEIDPVFAELAEPKLPELQKENRAWLQMQSPNRLYFYWSIKNNPFQTLQKVFAGNTGNYQLVAKFVNLKTDREEMHAVDAEGNYWFNAEADTKYQAEIGFYATGRPYIRVIFSNTIETPRKSPSPRIATDADWAVSARDFAEVLDISGFRQDAFEVALAGDDVEVAEAATGNAFYQLTGEQNLDFNSEEVRFALLAIASGVSLAELRGQISEALFNYLMANADKLSAENALAALKEHFDIFDEDVIEEEEEIGPAVFGASLLNFPKTMRKRTIPKTLLPKDSQKDAPQYLPKLSPLSSFSWKN